LEFSNLKFNWLKFKTKILNHFTSPVWSRDLFGYIAPTFPYACVQSYTLQKKSIWISLFFTVAALLCSYNIYGGILTLGSNFIGQPGPVDVGMGYGVHPPILKDIQVTSAHAGNQTSYIGSCR
jgi:hypothetical protein